MRNFALMALSALMGILLTGCPQARRTHYLVRPDLEVWKNQPKDYNVKLNCEVKGTDLNVDLLVQNFGVRPLVFDPRSVLTLQGQGEVSEEAVEYRILQPDSARLDMPTRKAASGVKAEVVRGAIFEGHYDFTLGRHEPESIRLKVQGLDEGAARVFAATCLKDRAGNPPKVSETQIEEYRQKVKTVVDKRTQEVKDCYIVGLKENPALEGELNLEWVIGTEGRIIEINTRSSTMNSKSAETCAIGKIRQWTFPEPPNNHEVVVAFPFQFERGR
jgi:hypothetical protein